MTTVSITLDSTDFLSPAMASSALLLAVAALESNPAHAEVIRDLEALRVKIKTAKGY